jgi:hypothetical protein
MWVRQISDSKGWVVEQETLSRRFAALPEDEFPLTKRYAAELTAGEGHHRFDFALRTDRRSRRPVIREAPRRGRRGRAHGAAAITASA